MTGEGKGRDLREIAGGAIAAAVGLAFLLASLRYGIGTLRSMRAGMFPLGASAALLAIGLAIVLDGLRRPPPEGPAESVSWRALLAVAGGIAAFALLVRPFGFVPAVAAAVVLSALGDPESRPVAIVALAGFLCLCVWLVFSVGLGMPLPAFGGGR
ncbi:tripartite tricarboxylate transporter TctB family protein [Faunimonas sp. B44]|uniref:tripartite tricarboxylate transporter TctB family protein n=1 Tax=Faunimonas sp. B44 TaxID=3461493 RepID=UPI0040441681